jgi:hypothetical protein
LTSLNLADNKIGAHYDSDRNLMVVTPEGITAQKAQEIPGVKYPVGNTPG